MALLNATIVFYPTKLAASNKLTGPEKIQSSICEIFLPLIDDRHAARKSLSGLFFLFINIYKICWHQVTNTDNVPIHCSVSYWFSSYRVATHL